MSAFGGEYDGLKDDVYEAMRNWLDHPGVLTRVQVMGEIADCLRYAAHHAAYLDKLDVRWGAADST